MKQFFLLRVVFILLLCYYSFDGVAQQIAGKDTFSIIPQPLTLEPQQGTFVLDRTTQIWIDGSEEVRGMAELFTQCLR